ncbi:MAG: hypothetical protein LBJ67_01035 [Planctomycetaceae bacterium]|nr:hypothetical protein [Planctomycetaceae bacterium]
MTQAVIQSGLIDAVNATPVLKLKLPYSKSDHVLNIAYHFSCGGTSLDEHIEYRRNDPTPLDILQPHSIPDPTTANKRKKKSCKTNNRKQHQTHLAQLSFHTLNDSLYLAKILNATSID